MNISIFILLPILGALIGALIGHRASKFYRHNKGQASASKNRQKYSGTPE